MKRSAVAVAVAIVLVGCGEKADDVKNAMAAVQAVAGGGARKGLENAEQFHNERVAKGDTIAISYTELKTYLPESISGYTAAGEAEGRSQAMPGFSMSLAEQTWTGTARADGSTPEITVSVIDFGGTQTGYAMMAAPMMMGFSQEDDHRRVGSIEIGVPDTGGWEEFDKDTKDAKLTALTRYRFVISVEARHHGEDKSAMVKDLAEEIARKFDGK